VSEQRLNLSKTNVLILQNNATELDILGQMFIGFAVKTIRKCLNVEEADLAVRTGTYDLIVVDADLPDNAGLDFIAAVRRQSDSPNKLVPILLTCGHTARAAINSGANFVVAKPITPKTMFDRVVWLSRDEREFVESQGYVGPDRRRKAFGPPSGQKGRRDSDLSVEVGAASGPDMSQSMIDAMLNPKKAVA
jgi:DNA-binding response OmpR family regulator